MISEIYSLFFKASSTVRHTAMVSQKKSGTSKKIQWDFQISRVGSLDFLDLKVNGSPGENMRFYVVFCYRRNFYRLIDLIAQCHITNDVFDDISSHSSNGEMFT